MTSSGAYRTAAQRFAQVETAQRTRAEAEDPSDDFSLQPEARFASSAPVQKPIPSEWLDRLRRLSAVFNKYPEVLGGAVSLSVQRETKYFATTEGVNIQQGRAAVQIMIAVTGKAPVRSRSRVPRRVDAAACACAATSPMRSASSA